jgi:8-oxo-dGTP diphosphatase / 2-hydroxy-dATP diphosphatase
MTKKYTLVLLERDGQMLLGMKKRGFGEGWWNGFGGKVHEGEGVKEAAKREVLEEVGITVHSLKQRGILNFTFEGEADTHEAYLFSCRDFSGDPEETGEMRPHWFRLDEMPYDYMWPADRIWMPKYLEGHDVNGRFNFTKDKKVGSYDLH